MVTQEPNDKAIRGDMSFRHQRERGRQWMWFILHQPRSTSLARTMATGKLNQNASHNVGLARLEEHHSFVAIAVILSYLCAAVKRTQTASNAIVKSSISMRPAPFQHQLALVQALRAVHKARTECISATNAVALGTSTYMSLYKSFSFPGILPCYFMIMGN